MAKASSNSMEALHGALAGVLNQELTREHKDQAGFTSGPPPALLNVVRQFLKDNGIETAVAPQEGTPIWDLNEALKGMDKPEDKLQ